MTQKLTLNNFIIKSQMIHGNIYDYSEVKYINSRSNVIIKCIIHGSFSQIPNAHIRGSKCPKCSKKASLTLEEFVALANIKHNNKYDYKFVIFINNNTKVKINCLEHGTFTQTPYEHLKGHKCSKCAGVGKLTTEEFINLAQQKHSFKYDYLNTNYTGSKYKVLITCKNHGDFLQTPNRHLQGDGCSKCSNIISKPETDWLNYLGVAKEYRQPKNFKINGLKIKPDAYNPLTNTIYEFYGDFYHGNPRKFDSFKVNPLTKKTYGELYLNTLKKEYIISKAGYKLITIWELDWNNIKSNLIWRSKWVE